MAILQEQVQEQTSKNHSNFIRICLDANIQSHTPEMKAMHATILYNYMTFQALNFVMEHQDFKTDAIKKAYDLKTECADFIELTNSLNNFLIAVGEALE
jgi:hypothetical protein